MAIGTHDLAKCRGPFSYEALPPAAISFVPLKQSRAFKADELMEVGWLVLVGVLIAGAVETSLVLTRLGLHAPAPG